MEISLHISINESSKQRTLIELALDSCLSHLRVF